MKSATPYFIFLLESVYLRLTKTYPKGNKSFLEKIGMREKL